MISDSSAPVLVAENPPAPSQPSSPIDAKPGPVSGDPANRITLHQMRRELRFWRAFYGLPHWPNPLHALGSTLPVQPPR